MLTTPLCALLSWARRSLRCLGTPLQTIIGTRCSLVTFFLTFSTLLFSLSLFTSFFWTWLDDLPVWGNLHSLVPPYFLNDGWLLLPSFLPSFFRFSFLCQDLLASLAKRLVVILSLTCTPTASSPFFTTMTRFAFFFFLSFLLRFPLECYWRHSLILLE